jgi:hypothetical protein
VHEAIAPLVQQTVTQAGAAAAQHVSSVMEAFERDLKTRRSADEALRRLVSEELTTLRNAAEGDPRSGSKTKCRLRSDAEAARR